MNERKRDVGQAVASLPMYDLPATEAANDRFWALIRERLRDAGVAAPEALRRGSDPWHDWEHPQLVFSQTCSLPYRTRLHGRVTLLGTPDYGLEGCPPGHYRSLAVARKHDPRAEMAAFDGARLAFNERLSQSGRAAALAHAAAAGIEFAAANETGSHAASVRAVAAGRADIAFIDAVTWILLCREGTLTESLHVIEGTDPVPGLPFIAGPGADREVLRGAIRAACHALSPADRLTLLLRDIVDIPAQAYLDLAHVFPA